MIHEIGSMGYESIWWLAFHLPDANVGMECAPYMDVSMGLSSIHDEFSVAICLIPRWYSMHA